MTRRAVPTTFELRAVRPAGTVVVPPRKENDSMPTLADNRTATRQWLELVSAGRIDELCQLVSTSWTLTHRGAVYPWHCDQWGT